MRQAQGNLLENHGKERSQRCSDVKVVCVGEVVGDKLDGRKVIKAEARCRIWWTAGEDAGEEGWWVRE